MRSVFFILSLVGVYLLLSGWPEPLNIWLRGALSVMVLLVGFLMWGGRDRGASDLFKGARKASVLDYVVALALLLVVELVSTTAVVVSSGVVLFTESDIVREAEHSEDGEWLWDQGFQREIPRSSDHKPPNRPEVFCEALNEDSLRFFNEEKVYLRGFSFDTYQGGSWSSSERTKRILRAQDGGVELAQVVDVLPQVKYRISLNPSGTGQDVALVMQEALTIDVPQLRQIAKGVFLLPESDEDRYVYKALSQPRNVDLLAKVDPNFSVGDTDRAYLQVPDNREIRARWNALLGSVKSEPDVRKKLEGIRRLLGERCRYSLKVENPNGLGPMDNFLFGEKRGYCEHFASASALLCREVGIPSRVAYGYAGGTLYPYSKLIVFRARDAHAWSEVYIEGYGWTVFDTTPSGEVAMQTAGGEEHPPMWEETSNDENSNAVSMTAWWSIGGGVVVLIGAAILVASMKSRKEARLASQMIGRNRPPAAYLDVFHAGCRAAGIRSVESLTLKELIERLPQKADFMEELEAYHNGLMYRGGTVNTSTERALLKKVTQWRAGITHAGD